MLKASQSRPKHPQALQLMAFIHPYGVVTRSSPCRAKGAAHAASRSPLRQRHRAGRVSTCMSAQAPSSGSGAKDWQCYRPFRPAARSGASRLLAGQHFMSTMPSSHHCSTRAIGRPRDSHRRILLFVRFRRIDLRQESEGELIVFQHPYKLGTICITGS